MSILFDLRTYKFNKSSLNIDHFNAVSFEDYIQKKYFYENSSVYKGIFGKLRAYFDIREIEEKEEYNSQSKFSEPGNVYFSGPAAQEYFEKLQKEHEEFAKRNSFSTALRELLEQKGFDHIEVYKSANIDRKLFSKIINEYKYTPSKKTIICLCLGMKLNIDETNDLLKRAGFTLSANILADVIISYCIENEIFDVDIVNNALFSCNQKLLCNY